MKAWYPNNIEHQVHNTLVIILQIHELSNKYWCYMGHFNHLSIWLVP